MSHDSAAAAAAAEKDLVDLNTVIKKVTEALDEYQAKHAFGRALPALTSAEFDFKTTVDKVGGVSVNFWIFKLGAAKTSEAINQVTFSYEPPVPERGLGAVPPQLKDALAQALEAAAIAIKNTDTEKLKLKKVAIAIQFGVKWDGSGGLAIPISLVTIGPNFDVNKNAVHSVKVTFGK